MTTLGRSPALPIASLAFSVALSTAITALPRTAEARCAAPNITLSHRAGETLPVDPVVYAFVPELIDARIHVRIDAVQGRQSVPAEVTEVSRSDAFVAYRVAITSGDLRKVTVRVRTDHDSLSATYRIDPSWQAPAASSGGILSATAVTRHWTCSYTDEYVLTLATAAPAYRVEWEGAGERGAAVFPRHMERFWTRRGAATAPGSVSLGHANCFGWTAPEELIDGCFEVTVTALYPDGSERLVTEEPHAIGCAAAKSDPPAAPGPVSEPPVEIASPPVSPAAPATAAPIAPTGIGLAWVLGSAAASLLIAFLWAGRRLRGVATRHAAHVARRSLPQIALVISAAGVTLLATRADALALDWPVALLAAPAAIAGASIGAALAMLRRARG